MKSFYNWLHESEAPQAGESSGKPAIFKPDAKPLKKYLTVDQIFQEVQGIPYYKEIVEDFDNKDYSWPVYQKVYEYAEHMYKNRNSLANLPPVIVVDGKLQDGAHRISALYLLQNRLDRTNAFWKNTKLEVLFAKKEDLAEGDYAMPQL